jgi:hypothetical protein
MQHSSFTYRPWRLTPGFLALAALLLAVAACAPGGSASPGQGQATNPATQSSPPATATQAAGSGNADQGTLNGTIVAAPSCPVETSDLPCPPKPVPNRQISIESTDGKVVATTTTDSNGRFSVNLAPGIYTLKVMPGATALPIQRKPVSVTIVAGKTISVQIELDSGIR